MIKPEDLRIGDLVRTNRDCAFPKGTMCVVDNIRPENVSKEKVGVVGLIATYDDDDGPWGAWCCNIEGIPLTPDSSKRTPLSMSNTKKTVIPSGTTSIITTSALILCTRSRKKETSSLSTSTAKS